jgi:transaldolase
MNRADRISGILDEGRVTFEHPRAHAGERTPLQRLTELGQSVWMDSIQRRTIASGALARYITVDGLRGVTTNPAIFEKAIAGSSDYDDALAALARQGKTAVEILDALTLQDVRAAADVFRPVFDQLGGRDGFVSIEVSPLLAHDTDATIAEGRRLWAAVARPNVMIKVPATLSGLPAIRQLVADGLNVNVTLLFGLQRHEAVMNAFVEGLASAAAAGGSPALPSVASFFLSRIDTLVDRRLDEIARAGGERGRAAAMLRGQTAIACARIAYQNWKRYFASERFAELARVGARRQRLLWASTGTKDPAYSDVKYVDALIGADTVNTMPLETFDAYREHGDPAPRLENDLDAAREVLARLGELGIDLDAVTAELERDGVQKFVQAHERLLVTLTDRCQRVLARA